MVELYTFFLFRLVGAFLIGQLHESASYDLRYFSIIVSIKKQILPSQKWPLLRGFGMK